MITFLIFLGKSSLALMFFFLFYHLVLAKDMLFKRNRFYLIGSIILSFALPWINIPLINAEPLTSTFIYVEDGKSAITQINNPEYQSFSWLKVLLFIYIIGAAYFILKTLFAYFQVFQIIKNALHIPLGKLKLVATPRSLSPFSFLHWIVVPDKIQNHVSFEKMVQHEMVHCRQYHSVDLFIAEILLFLQWFNPFAWFLRKSISENLEYLVDEQMLKEGNNARDYQYSLLSFSMVGLKPAVANYFNTNLLKKRIKMMNTIKYPGKYRFHNFLIPVILLVTILFTASFRKQPNTFALSPNNISSVKNRIIEQSRELKPNFKTEDISDQINGTNNYGNNTIYEDPRGEELFLGFIMKNIVYPKIALENNISGSKKVQIKFKKSGVEIITGDFSASASSMDFKQVVVVGLAPKGIKIRTTDEGNNTETADYLTKEIERVVKTFNNVPKDLIGNTYVLPVLFIINNESSSDNSSAEIKVTNENGEETVGTANYIILEENKIKVKSEPVYILDDEKIITKDEMQQIKPESIQSIDVRKRGIYKSEKLGEFSGSVVIIRTKK